MSYNLRFWVTLTTTLSLFILALLWSLTFDHLKGYIESAEFFIEAKLSEHFNGEGEI